MDIVLPASTNVARDAVTPQPQTNVGTGASPPQALPLETLTAVLSPAQATLVQILSDAVRNATALQGGLAALLPDLVKAQALVVVPPQVRAAIAGVIETTAQLQSFPNDAEITTALLKAGSAAPQAAAANAPPVTPNATPLPAPTDIRATLQVLQQALQHWVATEPVPAPASQSVQPSATPAAVPVPGNVTTTPPVASNPTPGSGPPPTIPQVPFATSAGSALAPLLAAQTQTTAPAPPGTALLQQPGLTGVAPALPATPLIQAQAAPGSEVGDATASLLLLQQSARSVTEAALRPRTPSAKAVASAPGRADPAPGYDSGLTYSKTPGQTPLSPITRWPANPDAAFVAHTLAIRTENALTQVKLLEVATQMQRADDKPQAASSPEPRWSFDIPFPTPQGHASARFEIERDMYRARNGKQARVWRVRFSIDTEPLGPVHAQIAIMGRNAWVSIIAERESSMRTLESQQQALLQGFSAEDISAEVICGVGKAPPRNSTADAGRRLDSAV